MLLQPFVRILDVFPDELELRQIVLEPATMGNDLQNVRSRYQ